MDFPHPRAYGNFARLLGKYARDEKVIPLEEAVRRLTSFPAETLRQRPDVRQAEQTVSAAASRVTQADAAQAHVAALEKAPALTIFMPQAASAPATSAKRRVRSRVMTVRS